VRPPYYDLALHLQTQRRNGLLAFLCFHLHLEVGLELSQQGQVESIEANRFFAAETEGFPVSV